MSKDADWAVAAIKANLRRYSKPTDESVKEKHRKKVEAMRERREAERRAAIERAEGGDA